MFESSVYPENRAFWYDSGMGIFNLNKYFKITIEQLENDSWALLAWRNEQERDVLNIETNFGAISQDMDEIKCFLGVDGLDRDDADY